MTFWWHAYHGTCEHLPGDLTIIIGPADLDPEGLLFEGHVTMPVSLGSCNCTIPYLRSWDHDPTNADRQAVGLWDEVEDEDWCDEDDVSDT